jgi:hypothetical protein
MAAPAKAAATNSWTPFVQLLMGQSKTGPAKSPAETGIQTAGIFGSNGSTYYVDPGFKGTVCGVDDETKAKVTVSDYPSVNEIKTLWTGLQSALKDDRNNDLAKSGIHFGGRKFMFSKVLEVSGKDAKDGTHKCIVGRCKNTSIILTPNAKSFTCILSAQNYNIGNITTHVFVAASLKKSNQ